MKKEKERKKLGPQNEDGIMNQDNINLQCTKTILSYQNEIIFIDLFG